MPIANKKRAPIKYKGLDATKRPTGAILAEILAIAELEAKPNSGAAAVGEAQWYVVRVIPGQERIVQGFMLGKRWGTYLPERNANSPIFPGYVFVWSKDVIADAPKIVAHDAAIEVVKYAGSENYASLGTDEHGQDWIAKVRQIEEYERAEIAWEFDAKDRAIRARMRSRTAAKRRRSGRKLKKFRQNCVETLDEVGVN